MKKTLLSIIILLMMPFTMLKCDMNYSPQPQQLTVESTNVSSTAGTIFSVNPQCQICNPSIAPEGVFSGCMLWLNFGGDLNVKVPATMTGYATDRANVRQHDRLTISDTTNTVRWYIMRDALGISGQIQDPEWSTDKDYVICLGDDKNNNRWSGHIIRLSDNAHLKVSDDNMEETSTPHLWIVPSAIQGKSSSTTLYPETRGGFADSAAIRTFFGTDSVKIVYAVKQNGLMLRFIDFSTPDPKPVQLPKPEGRSTWDVESPLISPDGRWVVFNCIGQGVYESYIQRLDEHAMPILLANNAADPHWWIHPEFKTTYIIYAMIKGDYYTIDDYSDPSLANGLIGGTYKQEIKVASMVLSAHAAFTPVGEPENIATLPFKGGLSRDGKYLCTGYGYGFIMSLK
jgi:hypothetical protein